MGGGVSGHIKLVPKFLEWVRGGLQGLHGHLVGGRLRRALAADGDREHAASARDRVFFGSDEPWSDFDSEYWKVNGVRGISQELKDNIFWRNFENLYDNRG